MTSRKLPALLAAAGLCLSGTAHANELVVGWAETNDTLNPVTTGKRNVGPILSNIFDTLVWISPDFEVEPLLAESWTVSDDGLTYVFKLREDVTFHDGTPFNAAAVVSNVEYITGENTQSKISLGLLGPCAHAEATGEYEVTFTCDEIYAPLLAQMGEPYLGMQSPAAIEEYGAELGQHPVGTGPFKFVSWTPSQSIVLEKNPDYNWMAASLGHDGPAAIDKITFQIVPNPQSRVQQFQSGQSQVMQQTPGLYWKTLTASGKYTELPVEISGLGIFAPINASLFPTDDILVRKAIMYAVDQKALIQLAEAGVYPPSYTPLSVGMLGHDEDAEGKYPYDPEKAKSLLTEAGWEFDGTTWTKDGKTLSVKITAISGKAHYMAQAQAIQGFLSEIGFDAQFEALNAPAWLDLNIDGGSTLTPSQYIGVDPDALHFWFLPDQYFNWSHWTNDELTDLIYQGRSELDHGKRAAIYQKIQDILLDNAVILPIRQNLDLTLADKSVTGITWSGGGFQYFGAASIAE
ncbi:ABC transporter substrate-binding protein [Mangrovicoccus sp. HB161399]|uniref:ABC transporter substrate-binding protein n=1 Tax=Mangrovicoccus sp. HB161399 TaxID=2720392 RepID=UPI001557A9D7|nr:ABC transporter substrate-binding protein [Mangrovicoccus sp. HB161399]